MNEVVSGADAAIALLRVALLAAAVVLGIICLLDWAVRTRRISPFNAVARFCRSTVDPIIAPIERKVVRAGGLPSTAPLWALAAVVIGGILLLSVVDFLRAQILMTMMASQAGSAGIFQLLVHWTFAILRIALIVRVISSWLPISRYSPWIRWSFGLTEPFLGPLRQVIPNLGMIDITPIIAYFLLGFLEAGLMRLV